MAYKYDPSKGQWTYVPDGDKTSSSNSSSNRNNNSNSNNSNSNRPQPSPPPPRQETPPTQKDNRETTETTTQAQQEYIEEEISILEGSAIVDPNPKYKAKSTMKLQGLGSQINGLYFVERVTHIFDSSGYSQELTLSREGFGDHIKKGHTLQPGVDSPQNSARPDERPTPPPLPPQEDGYELINRWGTVTPRIGLNVRTGNSTSHKILGAMTKGTRVFCIGKKGGWYDHKWKGNTAWSHADYIKLD